jgi:hypothetical protein
LLTARLDLDRKRGLMTRSDHAFRLPKCSFQFLTTRVGFLLRSAIVLERFFATADQVGLDLDPKPDLI